MPAETNAILQQQSRLGHLREYQIVEGKEIRIIQGTGGRQRVYAVHLLALADKSHVRMIITWGWFYLFVVSLVLLLLYFVIGAVVNIDSSLIKFTVAGALVLGAVLGLIMTLVNFSLQRVFYARHSRVPLFSLLIGKPTQREYRQFLQTMDHHITQARSFWRLKPEQEIAGEIRMLRRLARESVISDRSYERAKNHLFSISGKNPSSR